MALTKEQKLSLIKAYEPILYFHPDEAWQPIHPQKYIETSALWVAQPGGDESRHLKQNWGNGSADQAFPRKPIIPKNGISIDSREDVEGASDPDNDGVNEHYLGHQNDDGFIPYLLSDEDRMLFLDNAAWRDNDEVTNNSDNKEVSQENAEKKWIEDGLMENAGGWYHAEVHQFDTLQEILLAIQEEGLDLIHILEKVLTESYIIWYYFLLPMHKENMRGCEEIIGAGSHGNYEGDWQAIGVIVPKVPDIDDISTFPDPDFVAYGSRARGFVEDFIPFFRQYTDLRDWSAYEVRRIGLHPKVFVSKDSHNFYANTGPHDVPELGISATACGIADDVDEIISDLGESIDDAVATAVTVAKIAGGCGVGAIFGGPVGCLVGAAAGAVAALLESDSFGTGQIGDPPAGVPVDVQGDFSANEEDYGLILIPQELEGNFADEEFAAVVKPWSGSIEERMVDRETQPWWPPEEKFLGYRGRWGIMAQDDSFDRRSGMEFPDFKTALLLEMAINLSEQ
ncbi:hypothetical protein A9Q81_22080 [Gammaproteobacteria bacterium 42_54_T18]|nr:hypothetical protein A9Q81_22080 [Gammaproteobacteria bacterium 42_54_T18]